MKFGQVLRLLLMAALSPLLLYYAGDLLIGDGTWPLWHWILTASALVAAAVAGAVMFWWPQRLNGLLRVSEVLVRYCVAFLLISYALNKMIPGQFLLYNRDLDLPLRDLPARRLAWHFLGYSSLYNGFIAGFELIAGVLLCLPRTVLCGLFLTAAATTNIVVIDAAFGIRAIPIPAVMMIAAFVMIGGYFNALRSLISHSSAVSTQRTRYNVLSLGVLVLFIAFEIWQNVGARRGLASQVPPAGRWEVVECTSDPGLAICHPRSGVQSILYLEIGHWGEIVTDSERRSLQFSYDGASKDLEIRIQPRGPEPILILRGSVTEADNSILLQGSGPGVAPFEIRLRRTHHAPWPPARIG